MQISNISSTSSTHGATLLISLQVGSRALTFVVNQVLLRFLSPEIFGISTQLEVYSISVLLFARESLRVAVQRQSSASQDDVQNQHKPVPNGYVDGETAAGKTQIIVNLAYISIYLGFLFAGLLAWLYLRGISDSAVLATPYFLASLKIYGVAAVCELLSEPCFVVVQHRALYKIRARAEAISTLLRCIVTCASAAWASQAGHDLGILPFALGQAIYAFMLAALYYSSLRSIAISNGFSLKIAPIFSRLLPPEVH